MPAMAPTVITEGRPFNIDTEWTGVSPKLKPTAEPPSDGLGVRMPSVPPTVVTVVIDNFVDACKGCDS